MFKRNHLFVCLVMLLVVLMGITIYSTYQLASEVVVLSRKVQNASLEQTRLESLKLNYEAQVALGFGNVRISEMQKKQLPDWVPISGFVLLEELPWHDQNAVKSSALN